MPANNNNNNNQVKIVNRNWWIGILGTTTAAALLLWGMNRCGGVIPGCGESSKDKVETTVDASGDVHVNVGKKNSGEVNVIVNQPRNINAGTVNNKRSEKHETVVLVPGEPVFKNKPKEQPSVPDTVVVNVPKTQPKNTDGNVTVINDGGQVVVNGNIINNNVVVPDSKKSKDVIVIFKDAQKTRIRLGQPEIINHR